MQTAANKIGTIVLVHLYILSRLLMKNYIFIIQSSHTKLNISLFYKVSAIFTENQYNIIYNNIHLQFDTFKYMLTLA